MTNRFPDAALALGLLPAPAVIKTVDFEAIRSARIADFIARMAAKGLSYDVQDLESDPGILLQEESGYREMLALASINDAAKAVMILYAQKSDQDNLYPLVGIRRLTITPADPSASPPVDAVMEDDESFRARALIALEGTAPGLTGGGYASIALRAAPEVRRVSLKRLPGGVVKVILQGRSNGNGTLVTVTNPDGSIVVTWTADQTTAHNDGSVSASAIQAVAAALNDDWSSDPATGSQLTDIPMVQSCTPKPLDIVARGLVPKGPSKLALATQSMTQLITAGQSMQLIGNAVPTDALIAAGRLTPMTKFHLDMPEADFTCEAVEAPFLRSISVTISE